MSTEAKKKLVIVESPAKARAISRYLGKGYKVEASQGHVCDLPKSQLGVDPNQDFEMKYITIRGRGDILATLRKEAKNAKEIYFATDPDREGEAISWHLKTALKLDSPDSKKKVERITFNEITKTAVKNSLKSPRDIDMNLVDAQQARRVLDRMVGYSISPLLWAKVKRGLSAGRVQSVAVRLIVEREREIQDFKAESNFKVTAEFNLGNNEEGKTIILKAEYGERFSTEKEALDFLNKCKGQTFHVADISKKPMHKSPAPPFTTSTLQQEAARKLGFSVAQTMSVAQHLYESGLITYMRTDSVNLSTLCINASKKEIVEKIGDKYSKVRQYQTKAKGAQEAHEAIRPTYMDNHEIKGTANERHLYDLIWKRTIASQMADAQIEKTTIRIEADGKEASKADNNDNAAFFAYGDVVLFDGFLRVYRESFDDESESEQFQDTAIDQSIRKKQKAQFSEMAATQHFTQGPFRFTEASLVKKLEELGIGRPSTYAPTISTILQREYVEKGDKKGEKREYVVLTLKAGKDVKKTSKSEIVGNERGKLLPTDTGIVVNDFLVEFFPEIVNYNFTAQVEKEFDEIAEGKENWQKMMRTFYDSLMPEIDKVMNIQRDHKVGERVLGIDSASGRNVSVKIGRYGPIVQIGTAGGKEKPGFAQLNKGQSIHSITLEEALALFKLPRTLGDYNEDSIMVGTGKFGPYIKHCNRYVSIPKE